MTSYPYILEGLCPPLWKVGGGSNQFIGILRYVNIIHQSVTVSSNKHAHAAKHTYTNAAFTSISMYKI